MGVHIFKPSFFLFAVPSILNSLNDSLPDDLLFDNDAASSAAPASSTSNTSISTMTGATATVSQGNVVTAGGQQIRPQMPPGTATSVVTNGIVPNDVSKSTVTSSQQPIMVQQQAGNNAMRPNGPQPIVSNPNINLVNAFGSNGPQGGPQTVKMTAGGGSVVSNGPLMTVSGPLAQSNDVLNNTMNNGNQMMGVKQPNMPNNIIGGRPIMTGNQPIMGRMLRPGMVSHQFQSRQMAPNVSGIVGASGQMAGMNPRIGMNVRMQTGPPGGVAMVSNNQQFVCNPVVNTSGTAMPMPPNGQIRPTQMGGIPANGPQVNMPPQYQSQIESSGT